MMHFINININITHVCCQETQELWCDEVLWWGGVVWVVGVFLEMHDSLRFVFFARFTPEGVFWLLCLSVSHYSIRWIAALRNIYYSTMVMLRCFSWTHDWINREKLPCCNKCNETSLLWLRAEAISTAAWPFHQRIGCSIDPFTLLLLEIDRVCVTSAKRKENLTKNNSQCLSRKFGCQPWSP